MPVLTLYSPFPPPVLIKNSSPHVRTMIKRAQALQITDLPQGSIVACVDRSAKLDKGAEFLAILPLRIDTATPDQQQGHKTCSESHFFTIYTNSAAKVGKILQMFISC